LARSAALVGFIAIPPVLGQAPPNNFPAGAPTDHYGNPMPGPYGYYGGCDGCGGAVGYGHPPAMHGGFTGPFPMAAGGTCPPHGYDLMNDVGVEGFLVDQRGPHYFDVRAEAVYLERDETFERDIDFTSDQAIGQGGVANIVLSSRDLDYDGEVGFRIVGRYDIAPLSVFEFGYMGIYSYESSQTATNAQNELFSLFSDFGAFNPFLPVQVTEEGGPMIQTERASEHSISIESDLQTAELTYRRYWCGWVPRVSGTLLAGFRYTKLNEEFQFSTVGSTVEPINGELAFLDYTVDADNDLAGFQAGGDVWVGLIQGLRLGVEGKVGLYNNHYTLINQIDAFPVPEDGLEIFFDEEEFRDDQPALIAEASVDLVADILPSWSLRVGYEVLFINSIVLAGDNFNTASPFGLQGQPQRVPFVNDQSDIFYHGGHVGLEYIW
jgi:hypothetical protein